jgi:hypothetical protein
VADKSKKIFKFRKFKDIENMHCIWHPQGNHTTEDCRIFLDRYTRKGNKGDKKEDNQKKKERITLKTRDFSNKRKHSSHLCWNSRF